jgi:hypothetical protein
MKNSCLLVGLVAIAWLASAGPLRAQFWPGNSNYGYGAWGGFPYGPNDNNAEIAAQNRRTGQLATMGQNAMMQSGIRNTMANQAATRDSAILAQQQSNQDWWFQQQSAQMAQRRAQAYQPPPTAVAAVTNFEPSAPAVSRPKARTDIIQWPPLLQDAQFAQQRALIEAPYRRSPPGLSRPTAADYRDMIPVIDQMKGVLQRMAADVIAQDYLQAEAFLKLIGREARERSEQGVSAPMPK